jgi:hypothetical protein
MLGQDCSNLSLNLVRVLKKKVYVVFIQTGVDNGQV